MNVLGRLIGASFEMFIAGTGQSKMIGITGTFSMLVILGAVVIMTANKFFSLSHYLPEHVTAWIGQQLHGLGEKEDQSGVKNVFVGSTNAVSSGAQGLKEMRSGLPPHKPREPKDNSPVPDADWNYVNDPRLDTGRKMLPESTFRS